MTHDTLMALADTWAKGYSLHSKEGDEARAALSAAIAEVLAERDQLKQAINGDGVNSAVTWACEHCNGTGYVDEGDHDMGECLVGCNQCNASGKAAQKEKTE